MDYHHCGSQTIKHSHPAYRPSSSLLGKDQLYQACRFDIVGPCTNCLDSLTFGPSGQRTYFLVENFAEIVTFPSHPFLTQ